MRAIQNEAAEHAVRSPSAAETILLEWTVHHFREDRKRAAGIVLAFFVVLATGWGLYQSWVLATAGVFLLLSATAEFLFPIRHRLTDRRALVQYGAARLEIRWDEVKRVLAGEHGIKLSPLQSASRLDPFRGVLLRFREQDGISRERLLELIRERRPEAFS